MKKTTLFFAVLLAASLVAGCSSAASSASSENAAEENAAEENAAAEAGSAGGGLEKESIKTLGDAFAIVKDEYTEQRATYEDQYVYAFSVDGTLYRVSADLPAEIREQLFALEYDDNYDKNEMDLVKDLEVKNFENLDEQKLSQEELDALVGKTGQELFDAGWRSGMFYNTDTLEVWLEYGPFAYDMHFDGEIAPEEAEEFDVYEDLADKKVLDIRFEGVGDATFME